MFSSLRAAGFALAAFGASLSPAYASPPQAQDISAAPIASFAMQAAAALPSATLAINAIDVPVPLDYETDFSTPLDLHVLATPAVQTEVKALLDADKPKSKNLGELVSAY